MKINTLLASAVVLLTFTVCIDAKTTPKVGKAAQPIITSSSQSGNFGPQGLLGAVQPGWHSASPPSYPESVTVDFKTLRKFKSIGLLQQDGKPTRAPKALHIEISANGKTWAPAGGTDNACTPNKPDGWFTIDLAKPVKTRYLKLVIDANCGEPGFLTFRGLRVD